jgi:transcriptional regulator with XRE-family HTH domain
MNIHAITRRIKAIRVGKNLKQLSVARKAGLSLTGYSNIERGYNKNLSLESIYNIATALDVCVAEIILLEDLPLALQKICESFIRLHKPVMLDVEEIKPTGYTSPIIYRKHKKTRSSKRTERI